MKNLCNKERKRGDPYEVWATPDRLWRWEVLKKWQVDDLSLKGSRVVAIDCESVLSPPNPVGYSSARLVTPMPQLEVGNHVITSNAILVMDSLTLKQPASKFVLHNNAMLGFVFPVAITEWNKDEYITLFSYGSSPFVIPRMSRCTQATHLTENTSSILEKPTLANVLPPLVSAGSADIITPPTEVYVASSTYNPDGSLSHINSISHYIATLKPYARWFCDVYSPIMPGGEMGDVYVKDIQEYAEKIA